MATYEERYCPECGSHDDVVFREDDTGYCLGCDKTWGVEDMPVRTVVSCVRCGDDVLEGHAKDGLCEDCQGQRNGKRTRNFHLVLRGSGRYTELIQSHLRRTADVHTADKEMIEKANRAKNLLAEAELILSGL